MSCCRLDTDVHKIFRCKVSFKCRRQSRCFVIVDKELWTPLWSSTFGMLLLKKKKTATEVALTQLLSYNVSKHKNKNTMKTQNTMACSYHSKVTSAQNKGAPFSPVWVMEFSIISSCSSKVIILVEVQRLHENDKLI